MRTETGLAPVMLNQLARYGAVKELIEEAAPKTVLEVGSGSEGLARFTDGSYQLTACDHDFTDYGSTVLEEPEFDLCRVEGDVTDLPFQDGQFDLVLALDLMEHVPPDSRDVAVQEMARVCRGRVIVACPCGEAALESDRRLARYYDWLPRRERPPWLVEHLANGFPEPVDLERSLGQFGTVRLIGNERIGFHQALNRVEAIPLVVRATLWMASLLKPALVGEEQPGWRDRVLKFLRGYDRDPVYRQIAVLDRDPA